MNIHPYPNNYNTDQMEYINKNKRSYEETRTDEKISKFHKHTPSFRKPDLGRETNSCNNQNIRHRAPPLSFHHSQAIVDSNLPDSNIMEMDTNSSKPSLQSGERVSQQNNQALIQNFPTTPNTAVGSVVLKASEGNNRWVGYQSHLNDDKYRFNRPEEYSYRNFFD